MSAGAVIKYAMTLDGAQYMQELRRSVAETKAAEQAMKAEAKAMGVVTVSGDEVKKALASASRETNGYANGMTAASATARAFNASQSAVTQAMAGNYIGAAKSATAATRSLGAAMSLTPWTAVVGGVAIAVAAMVTYIAKLKEAAAQQKMTEAQGEGMFQNLNMIKFGTPAERAAKLASGMVASGDAVGLNAGKATSEGAMQRAERDAEQAILAWESATEKEKEAALKYAQAKMERYRDAKAQVDVYQNAIDELAKKHGAASAEEAKAAKESADEQIAQAERVAEAKKASEQAVYDFGQSIAEMNEAADKKQLQDELARREKNRDVVKSRLEGRAAALEEAAKAAKEKADKAQANAADKRDRWLNRKDREDEDREKQKAADKEARRMQELRERAGRGVRSKEIDAAKAAWEAQRDANRQVREAALVDKAAAGARTESERLLDNIDKGIAGLKTALS